MAAVGRREPLIATGARGVLPDSPKCRSEYHPFHGWLTPVSTEGVSCGLPETGESLTSARLRFRFLPSITQVLGFRRQDRRDGRQQ